MEIFQSAIDIMLHLDVYLASWAATLGPWLYACLLYTSDAADE